MSDSRTMLNQLEEVVKENISSVEMGVFKREMQRLQSIELEFVRLREEHNNLTEEYQAMNDERVKNKVEVDRILAREKDLEENEVEMVVRETKLKIDIELIDLRRENAEQRVTDHQEMVKLIFRGPVFQKTVIESSGRDVVSPVNINDSGSMAYPQQSHLNKNSNVTTTEKEL